jgi:hypothetical protein
LGTDGVGPHSYARKMVERAARPAVRHKERLESQLKSTYDIVMTDSQLPSEFGLFESLSKVVAVALALLYLLGFFVVASYLSRYGVASFSVLQIEYLIAGVWALGPPVLFASLVFVERRFDERAAPERSGKFNWRRFSISMVTQSLPSSLFLVLLALIPNVSDSMTWGIGGRLFLFFWTMVTCAQLFWASHQVETARETWWKNRSHAAPFYLALLLMIVLSYCLWFSARIYPLIPFPLGGGKPLTVAFFEGEKKMPEEIQRLDPSAKRSIPYKLLMATDKYFIVVSPSDKERSVEISRDSVAGMIVLSSN